MLTICDYSMAIRREALVLGVNAKGTVVMDGYTKGSPLNWKTAQTLFQCSDWFWHGRNSMPPLWKKC